jgi:3'-phosphoadenosine 5'-phosphosulfate sulfotransferase
MKVSATRDTEVFRPVELKILIESQDEYDAVFALGNWNTKIRNSLQDVSAVNPAIVLNVLRDIYEKLDATGVPITKE